MTDAVVVGSGPNGLAAALTLARAGLMVEVFEAHERIGGGLRSEPLFDSDVVHDICAAVHPMTPASPFMRSLDLEAHGVRLLRSAAAYAHPLKGGPAAVAWHDLDATCADLGGGDGRRWRRLMLPLMEHSAAVVDLMLSTQRTLPSPRALAVLAPRLPAHALRLGGGLRTEAARALLTGVAAHGIGRLPTPAAAAVALLLGHLAHTTGWPVVQGGSATLAAVMAAGIERLGGRIHTGVRVDDLRDLPARSITLLDVSPRELARIAPLPDGYLRRLSRYRYGPGAAKADFLVAGPIPWTDPRLSQAATIHLGGERGTAPELARAETATAKGRRTAYPYIIVVDPAAADAARAVRGRRPVWAYVHVPNGDTRNPVGMIRAAIETHAPGFTDTVIAERGLSAARLEMYNPNYVGGDIASGAMTLWQTLARPVPRWNPYRTPLSGTWLCSSATPPGPSVHGMCGYHAATAALGEQHRTGAKASA